MWAPTLPQLLTTSELLLSAADTAGEGAPAFDLGAATTGFVQANPDFLRM